MILDAEYYFSRELLFKPIREWMSSEFSGGLTENGFPILCIGETSLEVSSSKALVQARQIAQEWINLYFMDLGIEIGDITSTWIHPDTQIGEGTIVYPNTVIKEAVIIGKGCRIGPFAYIRPHSTIGDLAKIGDFVEIKNSNLGTGTSVSHLTYIGDSDVGERVNFGCGTVTVNYDGKNKFRTSIGDNSFIGCNTNLVAPVTIGEGVYTAAGSTITKDIESGLGIARAEQVNKNHWIPPKKRA
jgi:bifunctional UDP-N-acetylglucosamine pyrophosphorylase/glucosamine-1-phosphate N-acetyltransferase